MWKHSMHWRICWFKRHFEPRWSMKVDSIYSRVFLPVDKMTLMFYNM